MECLTLLEYHQCETHVYRYETSPHFDKEVGGMFIMVTLKTWPLLSFPFSSSTTVTLQSPVGTPSTLLRERNVH